MNRLNFNVIAESEPEKLRNEFSCIYKIIETVDRSTKELFYFA